MNAYVLIEMLAGAAPFAATCDKDVLRAEKRSLRSRLKGLLPQDVLCNGLLMSLIGGLIAPNPADRFTSAEEADFVEQGRRQLPSSASSRQSRE